MNRQEAIDRLKNEVKRIEEIMENGDCGCVDTDTWNEFAKKAEWRETLIELLTGPTPDPITGLVPCGCGGKPRLYDAYDGLKVIQCRGCGVSTLHIRPDDVQVIIDDWNAAMGGQP